MNSIGERMDAANMSSVLYVFSVSTRTVWINTILLMELVFRVAVTAQATALFAPAFLAGLALSGSGSALGTHRIVRGRHSAHSSGQAAAAVLLRHAERIRGGPFAASIGLLLAEIVQMAVGRFRLLALHVPLGVLLFGASIGLSIHAWLCRPTQSVAPQEICSAEATLKGLPINHRA
jgi:hypothetical protein